MYSNIYHMDVFVIIIAIINLTDHVLPSVELIQKMREDV